MRSEEELKQLYVNSHHRVIEKFFNELFQLSEDINTNSQKDVFDKANVLQEEIRKEISKQELTPEEKKYIESRISEWVKDKELNHDLMRHIFKKLIDNKQEIQKKKF